VEQLGTFGVLAKSLAMGPRLALTRNPSSWDHRPPPLLVGRFLRSAKKHLAQGVGELEPDTSGFLPLTDNGHGGLLRVHHVPGIAHNHPTNQGLVRPHFRQEERAGWLSRDLSPALDLLGLPGTPGLARDVPSPCGTSKPSLLPREAGGRAFY
jgi:hypothetical protein